MLRDTRVALRNFAREPGFAAGLVLTIRRVGELSSSLSRLACGPA